jgi:CheY-like chemotaxis protein
MRKSIQKEFGSFKPRAIVLDDSASFRQMAAHRLKRRGFEVLECANASDFKKLWKPGTVDVVIADWDLSHERSERGDKILEVVRKRDWDVPFVLISGKLGDSDERAPVLQQLLKSGGTRFVPRGDGGIQRACDSAEDLMERRDLSLLKLILPLRAAALEKKKMPTSRGKEPVQKLLSSIVAKPKASHDAERPIAIARAIRGAP